MNTTKPKQQQVRELNARIKRRKSYMGKKLLNWFSTPSGKEYVNKTNRLEVRKSQIQRELR